MASINSRSISTIINNCSTDIVAKRFANRIAIFITQCQSFGTIMNIVKDDNNDFRPDNLEVPFTVELLLGVEETIYKVMARKIASIVFKETSLPILLTIALKDRSQKTFLELNDALVKVNVWEDEAADNER